MHTYVKVKCTTTIAQRLRETGSKLLEGPYTVHEIAKYYLKVECDKNINCKHYDNH